MMLNKDSIGYWSFNCEELPISIKTKESENINDIIKDANDIITFAKNIEMKPISFNLTTRKAFNLFSLSYIYYYSILLEFIKINKISKYDKTKK